MSKSFFYRMRRLHQLFGNLIRPIWNYFKLGYQSNLWASYLKHFIARHLQEFSSKLGDDARDAGNIEGGRYKKLRNLTQGLHSLYPPIKKHSYSILIASCSKPDSLLKKTIESALDQTAPVLEVLVGFRKEHAFEIGLIIQELKNHSKFSILKSFELTENFEWAMINVLANEAHHHFILPLRSSDWIRPDYLYRCEQFLLLVTPPGSTCFYTDEFRISDDGYPLLGENWHKPSSLHFPYHFKDDLGHSLLVPRVEWLKTGGLSRDLLFGGLWELALRLELQGAVFRHIPFRLYAHRLAFKAPIQEKEHLMKALQRSTEAKKLSWKWEEGSLPHLLRVVPAITQTPKIQVIIPYKDQKELTLKAVKSVLHQEGVSVTITAVDHCSQDSAIAREIKQLGGEVLLAKGPFNYSLLNNFAVKETKLADKCEYLLFLNNDVELERGALLEMSRWVVQPGIGLVGCRLSYPNGLLQHGGIDIIQHGPNDRISWHHSEKMRGLSRLSNAKSLRLTDGVTAACALMSRSLFMQIGGFDEMWYPVAYSDTNLAVKLKAIGLKCFYTPYAHGTHYESLSREYDNIEDIEASRWLHELYIQNKTVVV